MAGKHCTLSSKSTEKALWKTIRNIKEIPLILQNIHLASLLKQYLLWINRRKSTLIRKYIMPEVLQILFWCQNDNWMKDSDCSGTKVYFRLQLVSANIFNSWEESVKNQKIWWEGGNSFSQSNLASRNATTVPVVKLYLLCLVFILYLSREVEFLHRGNTDMLGPPARKDWDHKNTIL